MKPACLSVPLIKPLVLKCSSSSRHANVCICHCVHLQISGAKVRLHEAPREAPRTAASQANVERQLDITGAEGQVQAAMKLVQAFLLAGNVEPLNIPDL